MPRSSLESSTEDPFPPDLRSCRAGEPDAGPGDLLVPDAPSVPFLRRPGASWAPYPRFAAREDGGGVVP